MSSSASSAGAYVSTEVESGWTATKQEAYALEAGAEALAAHYYQEADNWAKQLLGAKTWTQLHHIANELLGPESFIHSDTLVVK